MTGEGATFAAPSRGFDLFPDQVVEILVDTAAEYGSGYQVAPGLVLTARHVVTKGQAITVRFGASDSDEVMRVAAEIAWQGNVADLALLRPAEANTNADNLSKPPRRGFPGQPVLSTFGHVPRTGARVISFSAVGFPAYKQRTLPGGDVVRDADQVTGEIPLLSNRKTGLLDLQRQGRTLNIGDDWKGISGAAVFAHGLLVGVATEAEQEGTLLAVRVAVSTGQYSPELPEYREPAESVERFRALLLDAGLDPEPEIARRRPYAGRLSSLAKRTPQLLARETELADLAAFARSEASYEWWRGARYSGKTALAAHFAASPPHDVDVVEYFVSRRDGTQLTSDFLDSVCDQLAALVGEAPPQHAYTLLDQWQSAARVPKLSARHVVLLVDGLDENDDAPPIATLLPDEVPSGMHVLVFSTDDVDLPEEHPLKVCRQVYLAPVAPTEELLRRARDELEAVLGATGDPAPVLILGLLAVAGPLTDHEVATLLQREQEAVNPFRVGRVLRHEARRLVESSSPDRKGTWQLAHGLLRTDLLDALGDQVSRHRAALHAWAEEYALAGWPLDTPEYLVAHYPAALTDAKEYGRLVRLPAWDRIALLRHRTGDDHAAIRELDRALTRSGDVAEASLLDIFLLAHRRECLLRPIGQYPVTVILGWAALGEWTHVSRMVQHGDEELQSQVADAALEAGRLDLAIDIAHRFSDPDRRTELLTAVLLNATALQDYDAARTVAVSFEDPAARAAALATAAATAVAAGRQDRATLLLDDSRSAAATVQSPEARAGALAAVAAGAAQLDKRQLASELLRTVDTIAGSPLVSDQARLAVAVGAASSDATFGCEVAEAIDVPILRVLALAGTVGGAGTQTQDALDRAAEAAEETESSAEVVQAAVAIMVAAAKSGRRDVADEWLGRARAAVSEIDGPDARAQALAGIAQAATQCELDSAAAEAFSDAIAEASTVVPPENRVNVLSQVAEAAAQVGLDEPVARALDAAELIVTTRPTPMEQVQGFGELAQVAAQAGDDSRRNALLDAAEDIVWTRSTDHADSPIGGFEDVIDVVLRQHRGNLLDVAAEDAAAAGDYDRAKRLADAMTNVSSRARALGYAALAAVDSGVADEARTTLETAVSLLAASSRDLVHALAAAARGVAEAGRLDLAEPIARHIAADTARSQALAYLVTAATAAGNSEEAERIARSIQSPYYRALALKDAARAAFAQGRQRDAVEMLEAAWDGAQEIQRYGLKVEVRSAVSAAALAVGAYGLAEELARSDRGGPRLAWSLAPVARAAAAGGDRKRATRLLDEAESEVFSGRLPGPGPLIAIAEAAIAMDEPTRAHSAVAAAEDCARSEREGTDRAEALASVAELRAFVGDTQKAAALLVEAREEVRTVAPGTSAWSSASDIAKAAAHVGARDAVWATLDVIRDTGWRSLAAVRAARAADRADVAFARELLGAGEQAAASVEDVEDQVDYLVRVSDAALKIEQHDIAARAAARARQVARASAWSFDKAKYISAAGLLGQLAELAVDVEPATAQHVLTEILLSPAIKVPGVYAAVARIEPQAGPALVADVSQMSRVLATMAPAAPDP